MRTVYLESPFAGDVRENVAYAQRCAADCIDRGEAPFASHLFYTQFLNDDDAAQRKTGMEAGFAFASFCDATVVYIDRGLSAGMIEGIKRAIREHRPVEYRSLDNARVKLSLSLNASDAAAFIASAMRYSFTALKP